jgi:hypothetical protein
LHFYRQESSGQAPPLKWVKEAMTRIQSTTALALLLLAAGCGGGSEAAEAGGGEGEAAVSAAASPALVAGTQLVFTVEETVSTQDHTSGDTFTLRLASAVPAGNGVELPIGTRARGVVTSAKSSVDSDTPAQLGIAITSIEVDGVLVPVKSTVVSAGVSADAGDSGSRSAAKVGTGAAAGAIIGQILGGDTESTVAGAVVGTVAGAGVAAATRAGHAVLPQGATVTVRLDERLPVQ